jgi:hypothetical protein
MSFSKFPVYPPGVNQRPTPNKGMVATESRRLARIEKTECLARLMNEHKTAFSPGDEKNGQGMWFLYAIWKIQRAGSPGVTLREAAEYIRSENIWFKPEITFRNGSYFSASENAQCSPYQSNFLTGRKEDIMYLPEEYNCAGTDKVVNLIISQIQGAVVTPKRAHDIIRTTVIRSSQSGAQKFRVDFPPPNYRVYVGVEPVSESDEDAFGQFAPGVPGHGGVEEDDETDRPVLATVKRTPDFPRQEHVVVRDVGFGDIGGARWGRRGNKPVSLSPRVMEASNLSSETAALWNRECRSYAGVSAWLPDSEKDIEFWNNW